MQAVDQDQADDGEIGTEGTLDEGPAVGRCRATRADSGHSSRQAATVRAPVSSSSGSEKTDSSGARLLLMTPRRKAGSNRPLRRRA